MCDPGVTSDSEDPGLQPPKPAGQDLVEVVFQQAVQTGQVRNPAAYKARLTALAAAGQLMMAPATTTIIPASVSAVWDYYAAAYVQRYGVSPIRNTRVESQLAQLVSLLGDDPAGHVAEWYVGHNSATYVRGKHPVGLLLRDCEGLHTEWARGAQVTETDARMGDRTQSRLNTWMPLLQKAQEAEDAKAAENAKKNQNDE